MTIQISHLHILCVCMSLSVETHIHTAKLVLCMMSSLRLCAEQMTKHANIVMFVSTRTDFQLIICQWFAIISKNVYNVGPDAFARHPNAIRFIWYWLRTNHFAAVGCLTSLSLHLLSPFCFALSLYSSHPFASYASSGETGHFICIGYNLHYDMDQRISTMVIALK